MELAGAEVQFLDVGFFGRVENHAFELVRRGAPIERVFGDHEAGVGLPLGEGEGTVAHEVAGAGPRGAALVELAVFFDGGAMDGHPRAVGGEAEQVGRGAGERDAEGGVVDDGDADVGERF